MTRSAMLSPLYRAVAVPVAAALIFAAMPRTASAQVAVDEDVPSRLAPPPPPPGAPATRAPSAMPVAPLPATPGTGEPGRQALPEGAPPLPPGAVMGGYASPPRYKLRYEERRMTGLMGAGIGVFGGTWFLSAVFGGYVSDHGWFVLPVIGPLIYKSDDKSQEAALVLDAIVQAGGMAMLLAGALVKTKVAVREPVVLVPTVVPGGGSGLAVVGRW